MRLAALTALALLGLTAGCIRSFDAPHDISIAGLDLKPAEVRTQEVRLNVTTTLEARGSGDAGALRLRVKAYDAESGFLLAENATPVQAVRGDATRLVSLAVDVPRAGSVRVDVELYEDDARRGAASISARNLAALEPAVLDTGLRVGDVDFLVRNNTDGRPRIETDLYITNEGAQASEDLRVQVKAREVTTRLIADDQSLSTGSIPAGATVVRAVNLTVPDKYNYVFEIVTWRGDAIVARTSGNVQLAPTFQQPVDQQLVVTQPDLDRFIQPTASSAAQLADGGTSARYGAPQAATPAPKVPGFEMVVGVAAAGLVAIVLGRRRA